MKNRLVLWNPQNARKTNVWEGGWLGRRIAGWLGKWVSVCGGRVGWLMPVRIKPFPPEGGSVSEGMGECVGGCIYVSGRAASTFLGTLKA